MDASRTLQALRQQLVELRDCNTRLKSHAIPLPQAPGPQREPSVVWGMAWGALDGMVVESCSNAAELLPLLKKHGFEAKNLKEN